MNEIAETTFDITCQACTYNWKGYGLRIHIPEDSLPASSPRIRVVMKASLSGQYILPAGYELVSGVYWLQCPVELSKCVSLELQHCSDLSKQLSFVETTCTQEQLPYTFQHLEGGVFSKHSSHIRLSLSQFSGWAVVQKQSDIQQFHDQQPERQIYVAKVYYANPTHNMWQMLFTICNKKGLDLEEKVGTDLVYR